MTRFPSFAFKELASPTLWVTPIILSAVLLATSNVSYLLFHTLAELFPVIISFMMFTIAWPSLSFARNKTLIFLGTGYFWVGILDILHGITFTGMNLIPIEGPHLTVNFWLGARLAEVSILLVAPLLAKTRLNHYVMFAIFAVASLTLMAVVFLAPDVLPTFFIEGEGLQPIKIYSEYALIALCLVAMWVYLTRDIPLTRRETTLIVTAIALTILAELMFTRYVDLSGRYHIAGHLFKLFSYWLLFSSLVYSSLQLPYKQLEESRRDSRLADVVLARMRAGVWTYDPLYGRLRLNDEACKWFGCDAGEKISLDYWINRIPEDNRKIVEENFLIALKKAEPFEWTHTIASHDGKERVLHITGRPIIEKNTVVGLYGMMIDVTPDGGQATPA